jgi:cation:H+ antiporter
LVWLKFAGCVAIVLFSGIRLARYGDIIAAKTGLGRVWVGLVLIAIITSIPEVVTSISAVTLVKLPDLATGNVLGSCIFNLTLFVLADIIYRGGPVLGQLSPRHTLSTYFGMLLAAVVVGGILANERFPGLSWGWVSVPSIVILILYLAGVWRISRRELQHQPETIILSPEYGKLPARTVYLRFSLAAGVIVGAAIWLSVIGDEISVTYSLHTSFVGSLFVAITTSLPELAVTVAATHLGALDMAAANILGSNLFDLAIISFTDFAYREAPLFSVVSRCHLTTLLTFVVMNLILIAGLRSKPKRKTFRIISWYSIALMASYILGMVGVYYSLFTSL